jgi:tRNA A-37 threonylcarbamoyl transferase component Bud32
MHDVETDTAEIAIAGGWRGVAAVRAGGKELFSKADWEKLLASPEKLFEGTQHSLKCDVSNTITVKYLDIGGRGVKAALKRRRRSGIRGFFRAMGTAQAAQNFTIAIKIRQNGLPTAAPLAAVYRRKFLFCDRSIYISEYVEGVNLYEFLRYTEAKGNERHMIMQGLSRQMAGIFAGLHKNNLWHRDAKATNFVVNQGSEGDYRITITDVDGIKQYLSRSEERQMQGLWQLASSVMGLAGITRTDYLRMFEIYCDEVGIAIARRRDIYCRLAEKAQTKFRQRQLRHGR